MADAATETSPELAEQRGNARKTWLTRLAIAVLVVGVLWAAWYFLIGRNHVSTDNAYVQANKAYISAQVQGRAVEVMARTNQDEPGAKGVSAFIVERDTPGVTIGKPEKKMGQQGANVFLGRTLVRALCHFALEVVGRPLFTPGDREFVDLAAVHDVRDGLRRIAECNRQHA